MKSRRSKQLAHGQFRMTRDGVKKLAVSPDPRAHAHRVVDAGVEGRPAAVLLAVLVKVHAEPPWHALDVLVQSRQLEIAEAHGGAMMRDAEDGANFGHGNAKL